MVRGLSYYTGLVFEAHLKWFRAVRQHLRRRTFWQSRGTFNDRLKTSRALAERSGRPVFLRLWGAKGRLLPIAAQLQMFVGYRTDEQRNLACEIAGKLRELGVNTDFYCGSSKVKAFYEHANRSGVPVTICVMDRSSFVIKDMYHSSEDRNYRGVDVAEMGLAVENICGVLNTHRKKDETVA